MSLLNQETNNTNGASVTHQVKAETRSTISRKMHAELKLNAHLVAESRDNLAVELARSNGLSPQEMLDKVVQVKNLAQQAENLSSSYDEALNTELTQSDITAMKQMADKHGQKVTAKCFGISQPAVSDHLTGKTKVSKK